MRGPFEGIKIKNSRVLELFADLPKPTRKCLNEAFYKIKEGDIDLLELGEPNFYTAKLCDHYIYMSHKQGIIYVTEIISV